MRTPRRIAMGAVAASAAIILTAGPGLAHECVNANRNGVAGAQIVFGDNDEILFITTGLQNRIAQGLVNPDTGEGFSGLVGFDIDGDGVGDVATWIVGPNGELPTTAQFNGQPCQGVTNIEVWFEECLG